eukprot:TRINITY_DN4548_c0_g1_i1.p1 TRINITY_DN4548_c0_g1~~TRINITY_DN4548_c0_g1_i1.p1  ORF type:complete len:258 (+),score=43.41 TRINITY_DN4548_c0_g1_i1:469-1242(+)
MDLLREEFSSIRSFDYEPEEKANSLTSGTYWMDLKNGVKARNAIERYIQVVTESNPIPDLSSKVCGAEWWWQQQDFDDEPKEYHTDCDLCYGGESGTVLKYPLMSSVLYCSSVGGPTIVFDQEKIDGDLVPSTPTKYLLSFPKTGRLLLFHGKLYHGVLQCPIPEDQPRLTLLVNWWTERPNGPHDLPPVFDFSNQGADYSVIKRSVSSVGKPVTIARGSYGDDGNEEAINNNMIPNTLKDELSEIGNSVVQVTFRQ